MRMGQGVRTGLGHGGNTCVLQTQFSSFFLGFFLAGGGGVLHEGSIMSGLPHQFNDFQLTQSRAR